MEYGGYEMKRLLSLLLCLALCCSFFPGAAFASEDGEQEPAISEQIPFDSLDTEAEQQPSAEDMPEAEQTDEMDTEEPEQPAQPVIFSRGRNLSSKSGGSSADSKRISALWRSSYSQSVFSQ